jgi:lia operon protein LiaG
MYDKIRQYIDTLFEGVPESEKTLALKEKVYADTAGKYNNFISDGMEPEEAFTNAVNSIGDIRSLLPEADSSYQKDLSCLSESKGTAVSLADKQERKIKFIKSLSGSVSVTLWMITIFVYLAASFLTGQWQITWIIFFIAAILQSIISQLFRFALGKRNPVGLIISIIIIVFIAGAVFPNISRFNSGGLTFMNISNSKLVNTQSISLKNIDSIEISYMSEDITVLESDTDEIVVKEYMSGNPSENELADITTQGSRLIIKNGDRKMFNLSLGFLKAGTIYDRTEIYLPKSYTKALSITTASGEIKSSLDLMLTDFKAETASGDIFFESVNAENINIATASGGIKLENAVSEKDIKLSTASGDIFTDYAQADLIDTHTISGEIFIDEAHGEVTAKSTSGDIKLSGGENSINLSTASGEISAENSNGTLNVSSVSGDIKLIECSDGGNITTTSGDIFYECTSLADLTMSSTSGGIKLTVPEESAFNFKAETTSGDIKTYFDDIASYNKKGNNVTASVGISPKYSVKISTTSSDIGVFSE